MIKNKVVKFTAKQTEAIIGSLFGGISLIVGPPGSGKTDVAVQTLVLLYKNYPDQKILVIAQSNQAINDIFEKVIILIFFFNIKKSFLKQKLYFLFNISINKIF